MIDIVIQKSSNPKKKYDAIFNGVKTIQFGASGYEDYTIHKDAKRRENYINSKVMRSGVGIILNQLLGYHVGFYGKNQH